MIVYETSSSAYGISATAAVAATATYTSNAVLLELTGTSFPHLGFDGAMITLTIVKASGAGTDDLVVQILSSPDGSAFDTAPTINFHGGGSGVIESILTGPIGVWAFRVKEETVDALASDTWRSSFAFTPFGGCVAFKVAILKEGTTDAYTLTLAVRRFKIQEGRG